MVTVQKYDFDGENKAKSRTIREPGQTDRQHSSVWVQLLSDSIIPAFLWVLFKELFQKKKHFLPNIKWLQFVQAVIPTGTQ